MLDQIRSNRKFMLFILVVLVTPAMIFLGAGNYRSGGGKEASLAKIKGEKIYRGHVDQRIQTFSRQNPELDFRLIDTPEIRMQVLSELLSEQLWSIGAQQKRMQVSPKALRVALLKNSSVEAIIGNIGALDEAGRKEALKEYSDYIARGYGLSTEDYESNVRISAMADRLQEPLTMAFTSKIDLEQFIIMGYSQYHTKIETISSNDFVDQVEVTDEQINAYYQDNQVIFMNPAYISIEYVVFDALSLAEEAEVTESDIRAYYEQNKVLFNIPEERRISHILIESGEGAEQKAQELLLQVKADPSRFAEIAKASSSDVTTATDGGDLGFITKGMMSPLDDAAFALPQGDVSDVIKSSFGYHIITVTDIKTAKTFEDVHSEIEAGLRRQIANQQASLAAAKFTELVQTNRSSFEAVAQEFNLTIQKAEHITSEPNPSASGVLSNRDLIAALFRPEALSNQQTTDVIKVGATMLTSARVVNHTPAAAKPLAEVKEQIRAYLQQEAGLEFAKSAAEEKQKQWSVDPTLAKNADEISFSQDEAAQWLRAMQQENVDPMVAFTMRDSLIIADKTLSRSPVAENLPQSYVVELPSSGYAVVQLYAIDLPDVTNELLVMQKAATLNRVVGQSQANAYIATLEKELEVVIAPNVFELLSAE